MATLTAATQLQVAQAVTAFGGDGGIGGDVFGGTGADGASACETTDSSL